MEEWEAEVPTDETVVDERNGTSWGGLKLSFDCGRMEGGEGGG